MRLRIGYFTALATWWHGDALPTLDSLPGFHVALAQDVSLIAQVTGLTPAQVQARRAGGHQVHLAFIGDAAVGYGWVAQRQAEIGELGLRFALPSTDRYLWDFATLPAWQGYGIYPRLLQSILTQQPLPVERIWIIYAPENTPSGAGMDKAGLAAVGDLSFDLEGRVGLVPRGGRERAQVGAALLGVPLLADRLAPCWACGGTLPTSSTPLDSVNCWPPQPATTTPCTCAVALRPAKPLIRLQTSVTPGGNDGNF